MKKQTFLLLGSLFFLYTACQVKPTAKNLLSDNPDKRGEAITKLIELDDEDLQSLVPDLIKALKDSKTRRINRAIDALSIIGKPAVPALSQVLDSPDVYVRLSAATCLGLIGEPSVSAIPKIMNLLSDDHPLVRDEAATSLGFIGPLAKEAVPLLIKSLSDENEDVRRSAATALDRIGTPEAQKALEKYQGAKGTS